MELAKRAGISQHSISKIETGHTTPRPETMEKLATALEVEDPEVLTVENTGVVSFEEILEGSQDKRRLFFEHGREVGQLSPFIEQLEHLYAANRERYQDDPVLRGQLEVAYMLGFAKGYHEGRSRKGADDET